MTPQKYKITLEQLRMAASKYRVNRMNPCIEEIEKLFIAIEATNMNYMSMRKYINELDNCIARNPRSSFLKEKKSTMYYLNQYLDQQKHKTK